MNAVPTHPPTWRRLVVWRLMMAVRSFSGRGPPSGHLFPLATLLCNSLSSEVCTDTGYLSNLLSRDFPKQVFPAPACPPACAWLSRVLVDHSLLGDIMFVFSCLLAFFELFDCCVLCTSPATTPPVSSLRGDTLHDERRHFGFEQGLGLRGWTGGTGNLASW